ncbi:hypothetical protein, partial [Eubacterium aggregans]|uniref:hypothetical protein n=1 Tax=Eubacterium aggregans TaxID=81409 RepID=UPI003F2D90CC
LNSESSLCLLSLNLQVFGISLRLGFIIALPDANATTSFRVFNGFSLGNNEQANPFIHPFLWKNPGVSRIIELILRNKGW